MAKHGIEGDPDDYCLVQLIPGGGISVIFVLFKIFINNVLSCLIGIQIFPQKQTKHHNHLHLETSNFL